MNKTLTQHTCPCGCGTKLGTYNGHRLIVCYRTWCKVPPNTRAIFMSRASTRLEKLSAARDIFELAYEIKNTREAA